MPNPIWAANVPVLSNRVLELQRGNQLQYTYTLPSGTFPTGTTAAMAVFDTSGNVIDAWSGAVSGASISFVQASSVADAVPAGSSWTLVVTYPGAANATMLMQGTVVRNEAPFPGQAPTNVLDAVDYSYTFSTPGILSDIAWNVLTGQPVVYDNSSVNLPNAVAAGAPSVEYLDTGSVAVLSDANPWSQAAMLYYAPLPSDVVSMSYNIVQGAGVLGGETWIVVNSAYDMSSGVAFFHQQFSAEGTPTVGIATMSGPTTFDVQESVPYTSNSNENFIAQYNPATNTYALFLFGNTTPLVTWTDEANSVPHGPGYRYVGFTFESGLQAPGVEIANWSINPNAIYSAAEYSSNTYTANATAVVPPWANTIQLIGVGGGGGGNGENLIVVGFGGFAGSWNATTLTVGDNGAAGIKAGSTITITVGQGGAGGAYFTVGNPGTATTFSWVDAAGTAQSLTCAGGLGGAVDTSNPLEWGLSPGNLTFGGQTYYGGGIQVIGGLPGIAPGGGGTGGAPFEFGAGGAIGQAWVVAEQTSTTSNGPQSQTFTASTSYTPPSWASEVDLIGVGGGAGGNGVQDSIITGYGGMAGVWGATTLKVGTNGATGLKAGTAITVTVGAGGTGGVYTADGYPGAATTFSWVDASGAAQSFSCGGGPAGASSTNLTAWGLSPGNLTYEQVPYTGGLLNITQGTAGVAPGGGGPGGVPGVSSGNGMPGGGGQAWIVDREN